METIPSTCARYVRIFCIRRFYQTTDVALITRCSLGILPSSSPHNTVREGLWNRHNYLKEKELEKVLLSWIAPRSERGKKSLFLTHSMPASLSSGGGDVIWLMDGYCISFCCGSRGNKLVETDLMKMAVKQCFAFREYIDTYNRGVRNSFTAFSVSNYCFPHLCN